MLCKCSFQSKLIKKVFFVFIFSNVNIKLGLKTFTKSKLLVKLTSGQVVAGLDCQIGQSGLQSNLVDWIVIDNPVFDSSKLS